MALRPSETNEGDTTYGLDYFNPAKPFAMTIWDSGGVDTIDLATFTKDCDLSLVSVSSSTVACEDAANSGGWLNGQMPNNLSIAFDTYIENIIAGSGNDTIVGNDQANVINGGAGADTITGGAEADTFEFFGDFGTDTIADFIVGTDLLSFKDANGVVIDTTGITDSVSGSDLVLTVSVGNTVTLAGLGAETFDDGFLV